MDGAGYRTLVDNLLAFKELNCLPCNMFPWLKQDEVSEDNLRSHKAKWHESCTLQYNKTEVKRAAKQKAAPAVCEDVPMNRYTCASVRPSVKTELCCFLRVKPRKASEFMHQASTFGLDPRV